MNNKTTEALLKVSRAIERASPSRHIRTRTATTIITKDPDSPLTPQPARSPMRSPSKRAQNLKRSTQLLIKAQMVRKVAQQVKDNYKTQNNSQMFESKLAKTKQSTHFGSNPKLLKKLSLQQFCTLNQAAQTFETAICSEMTSVTIKTPKLKCLINRQQILKIPEVKQSESFIVNDKQDSVQESFVEKKGKNVLDYGVCQGKISQFKILRFIDQGVFGKVYLAQSHINKAVYSVKSIYKSSMTQQIVTQFARQVKIQLFLNHPNIVKLYNYSVDEECAYLVMQACMGGNLYSQIKQHGKIPEPKVKEWIKQVCQAVNYMHDNSIIHRDIKPQNVLLHQNMVKICDFGWAVYSPVLRKTRCGTPLYAPPEIVKGTQYDSKIDVWSIGILTYQLLYGTIPFEIRQSEDLSKIVEQQVYFCSKGKVSQLAQDFIKCCLHKNPTQRCTVRQLLKHEFLISLNKTH